MPYPCISQRQTFGKEQTFLFPFLEYDNKIFVKGSGNTSVSKEETGCGKFGTDLFKIH